VRVDDFDFLLPEELIAVDPIEPRDASRMLCVSPRKEPTIKDQNFRDLLTLLNPGDCLVFNDTKVIPAHITGLRIRGENAASIQFNLNRPLPDGSWSAFAKPAKKLKEGDLVQFNDDVKAHIVSKKDRGEVILSFDVKNADLFDIFSQIGSTPLPPYIASKRRAEDLDVNRYQTVFADKPGAVAAPTAGLHFTNDFIEQLKAKGVIITYVTLHVGGGTFLPVAVEDTKDHHMHAEYAILTDKTAQIINATKADGKRVIATGTTALRVLESAAQKDMMKPFEGDTDIFIEPGYQFKCVDALITNFHLPRSTLFMLVSALCGTDLMKEAYAHAIAEKYRFFSYGDACFLER